MQNKGVFVSSWHPKNKTPIVIAPPPPPHECSLTFWDNEDNLSYMFFLFISEIGYLPCLKSLNVSNNFLTTIPSSIGKLKQLEYLHLANNKLSFLCESKSSNLKLTIYLNDLKLIIIEQFTKTKFVFS